MLSIKQQHENLKNVLEEAIKTLKDNPSSDICYSNFFDKLYLYLEDLGYDFDCDSEVEGDWTQDEKYQYLEDHVQKFSINGIDFYAEVSATRSGSDFDDWEYYDLHIGKLLSKEEYLAPKPIFTQETEDFIFNFYDDQTVLLTIKESGEELHFVNFDFTLKYIKK